MKLVQGDQQIHILLVASCLILFAARVELIRKHYVNVDERLS